MYWQIELETTKGKFFLGPFVFRLEDAIRKLGQMDWLTKTKPGKKQGKHRLIPVEGGYPREALWHPTFDDESGGRHDERVKQVEFAWIRYWAGKEEKDATDLGCVS